MYWKQGWAFGQNFLLCPTDGRAEVQNFSLVRPKAEPSRIVRLSENRSARLSARLPSTFSDKFGHRTAELPRLLELNLERYLCFFFLNNYFSRTNDNLTMFFTVSAEFRPQKIASYNLKTINYSIILVNYKL